MCRYSLRMALVVLVAPFVVMQAGTVDGAKDGSDNRLVTAFHHVSEQPLLELCRLVFYFEKEPIVNALPEYKEQQEHNTYVFFFPKIVCKDDVVRSVNHIQGKGYDIQVSLEEKPIKGMKVTIVLDSKQALFDYASFDSIGLKKGIAFTLYDKQLLAELQKRGGSLLQTACADTHKTIVIDCGHGGKDSGTIGWQGIKEKEVSLAVGLQLAALLQKNGHSVVLTRATDEYVSFARRSSCAQQAQLLVSVHANSSSNKEAQGVETFCLHPTLFKKQFMNMPAGQHEQIEALKGPYYTQTSLLAHAVQQGLVGDIAAKYRSCIDRSVRHAVGKLMLMVDAPVVLVEVGFLSHPKEASLLASSHYVADVAQGICKGIEAYCKQMVY